jgi:predicted GNAT family acetyltransferase
VTETRVRDNHELSRWELLDGDEVVSYADYRLRDDVVVITHTETHPSRRGDGLAERLVRAALDGIRSAGRRVEPRCWFVAEFLAANDDYRDLRAG